MPRSRASVYKRSRASHRYSMELGGGSEFLKKNRGPPKVETKQKRAGKGTSMRGGPVFSSQVEGGGNYITLGGDAQDDAKGAGCLLTTVSRDRLKGRSCLDRGRRAIR